MLNVVAMKAGWATTKRLAGAVPPIVWYVLAAALLLLVLRWHWIGVGVDRCEARQARAQATANERQVKAEAKRDTAATKVATRSHAEAAAAVARTEESTHAREVQIIEVPVAGVCVAPVGLPNLAPAVEAANAARRAPVPGGSYSRREYRSIADSGGADRRSLDEGHVVLGK